MAEYGREDRGSSDKRMAPGDERADLHLHTNLSDGAYSPYELVKRAADAGLSSISITDHDNIAAIDEAIEWGKSYGIEVIPGLELSVTIGEREVHLLAYFLDHTHPELLEYLALFRRERFRRAQRIVEKLNRINIPLSFDAVLEQAGEGSIGRPHIATALVDEGLTYSYQQAFAKYLGIGAPAYEKKYQATAEDMVRLINATRGLMFLAHPGKYTNEVELTTLIRLGLDGIEVIHPSHDAQRVAFYRGVVNQYFLLESGGSDFHGGKKGDDQNFGSYTIPMQVVETMRNRL